MKYKFQVSEKNAVANNQFQAFKAGFLANAIGLGFDVADMDAVSAVADEYALALIAKNKAEVALRNAVEEKDAKLAEASALIRLYVNRVISNPEATPTVFTSMGIEPYSSNPGAVLPPTELSVTPNANGTAKIKWKRNGNIQGTTWLVEVSIAGGPFQWLANSSKLSFTDQCAVPGMMRTYRVRAQRKGIVSPPSAGAAIYSAFGESSDLKVA